MKKCPYCAEDVQDEALICKHCKRNLPQMGICRRCKKVLPEGVNLRCPFCHNLTGFGSFLILIGLIASFFFWKIAVAILAIFAIGWIVLYIHDNPKITHEIQRKSSTFFGLVTEKSKKWLPSKYLWATVSGCLILFILGFGIFSYFSPSAAVISVPSQVAFHGSGFTLKGTITANCPCSIYAQLDDKELTLGKDGSFQEVVAVPVSTDDGKLSLTARVSGFLSDEVKVNSTVNYQREESPCRVVEYPKEWGKDEAIVKVHCPPDGTLSGSGADKTVTVPFNTAYDVETVPLSIHLMQNGYADYVQEIQVTNTKYDPKRVAKEADAAAREAARVAAEQTATQLNNYKYAIGQSSDQLVSAMKSMKSAITDWHKAYEEDDGNGDVATIAAYFLAYKKDTEEARQHIQKAEEIANGISIVPSNLQNLHAKWEAAIQGYKLIPDQMDMVVATFADDQDTAVLMAENLSSKMQPLFDATALLSAGLQNAW